MKNPAVDAYIAKSPDFARPILKHVRALMHKACPKIEETVKWGVPNFEYKGIVAMMAAFKQHATFGFWSEKLLKEKLGKDARGRCFRAESSAAWAAASSGRSPTCRRMRSSFARSRPP